MAFADEVDFDGRLLWWGLEICTAGDDFATVQYRWATLAADVGGNHFEERLAAIGNIQKALGNDHLPVAGTVELLIDNIDKAADWLVNRDTVETAVFQSRFRLLVGVATSAVNTYQATIVTQQVGVYVPLDFPSRDAAAVKLSLTDDSLGKLNDLLIPPTMADWRNDPGNTNDNSLFSNVTWGSEIAGLIDFDTPIPLQFGVPPYIGAPAYYWNKKPTPADFDVGDWEAGQRPNCFPIIVLATRDDATISADDVTGLRGTFRRDLGQDMASDPNGNSSTPSEGDPLAGTTLVIPQTFNNTSVGGATHGRIWKAYKTQTITKDGYDWKLLWIAFNASNYADWFRITHTSVVQGQPRIGTAPILFNNFNIDNNGNMFAAFERFEIAGRPGSGVLGQSIDTYRNPVNIMFDLIESYSSMGAGGADSARFVRARNAMRMDAKGEVSAGDGAFARTGMQLNSEAGPYGVGQLRRAIADLARSSDMDVFITSEGKAAVAVMAADFETQTSTYPTVAEERINNVIDSTPSQGQRWSPYNRVFVKCPDGRVRGPFDDSAAIAAWNRVIPRTIDGKWWWHKVVRTFEPGQNAKDTPTVKELRFIESKVRPVITFTTDVGILTLELADYFLMSWTRGGSNAAYSNTLWRLESTTTTPENGSVAVTAVWMGDLQTDQPFLLDNEDLFLRVAGAGGRTCTVIDGTNDPTFSSGDLVADGVLSGDILLIRDSSEAGTTFFRSRQIRIDSVLSATQLELTGPAGYDDFGPGGPHVIADTDWVIVRGFTTYPVNNDDPVNYPNGSLMYGKISNSVGQFSDATPANKLLDG